MDHLCVEPKLMNEFLSILHFFNLHLFPHLSDLTFSSVGTEAAPTISIWLRPTLKHLDVDLTDPSENVCNFMVKSLSQQTPGLTSLSKMFSRLDFSPLVIVDALATGIQGLLHLTLLSSEWQVMFRPSLWSQLAVLPALEELDGFQVNQVSAMDFPFDVNTWSTSLSLRLDSSFQSLKCFTGTTPCWLVAEIFQLSRMSSLEQLYLMVTGMPQSEDISFLPVHSDHRHLETIVLNFCDWTFPPSSFDHFRPPSCLEGLAIWTRDVLPINNRQLLDLCNTLPCLKYLELGPCHHPTTVPYITLEVIPGLVKACPKLEDLYLFLDTNLSSVCSFDGYTSLTHNLNSLDFGASPVENALEVAAFLSILFPSDHLTPVINDDPFQHFYNWEIPELPDDAVTADRAEKWSEVKEMLNLLQRRLMGRDRRRKSKLLKLQSKLRDQADGQE